MAKSKRMKHAKMPVAPSLDIESSIKNSTRCEDWQRQLTEIVDPGTPAWSERTGISSDIEADYVPQSMYSHQRINLCEYPEGKDMTARRFESDLLESSSRPMPSSIPFLRHLLPGYLDLFPRNMTWVDIDFLFVKGALSIPDTPVRNALLQSYLEYAHPYMPVIELHEMIEIIEDGTGASGRISLLLFQAIMFAGTAFVDINFLRRAGFPNRKAARMAFFQRAKILYDFDYEPDRVSVIQSILLMSYWYETPEEEEDACYWTSLAISLAYRIGIHRDPKQLDIEPQKKKLWKRIWWSCFMQDHLIALAMRRPTRVKIEDYNVPILTDDDLEIPLLSDFITVVSPGCKLRDIRAQRKQGEIFIAKAKVCWCISRLISTQCLVPCQGPQGQEGSTGSNIMLCSETLDKTEEIRGYGIESSPRISKPPDENGAENSAASILLKGTLLDIAHLTTLSILHGSQIPSVTSEKLGTSRELCKVLQKKVRRASRDIIRLSQDLDAHNLERYLPDTSDTIILLAIIIRLLDIESCKEASGEASIDSFCQDIFVLEELEPQDTCTSFALRFLQAIHKDTSVVARPLSLEQPLTAVLGGVDKIAEECARWTLPFRNNHDIEFDPEFDPDFDFDFDFDFDVDSVTLCGAADSLTTATESGGDIDLNDFLIFDSTNETWNAPLGESTDDETGSFMDDGN